MEASVLRLFGDEDFVTLVLVAFESRDQIEVVNVGHPPPLRLSAAGAEALSGEEVSPPLGLPY
jgi:serine phosphatase RsbU (regulator of sigma subunit)